MIVLTFYICIIRKELIDIEGSRSNILETFWKSTYLYVTYRIYLKKGTGPHHFRKRNIITNCCRTLHAEDFRIPGALTFTIRKARVFLRPAPHPPTFFGAPRNYSRVLRAEKAFRCHVALRVDFLEFSLPKIVAKALSLNLIERQFNSKWSLQICSR